jgi:hypothetical protein
MSVKVEFENERVRVSRVRHSSHERLPLATRADRVIVYLDDGEVTREEGAETRTLVRKRGEVVWRPRSTHVIENARQDAHEVLIIELK